MKNLFPGYFRPTEEEFEQLWQDCTFIPDANVLLNLYRYSPETREGLLSIFSAVSDRLWLPHQVAFEFLSNRLGVIDAQTKAYKKAIEALQELPGKLDKPL